MVSAVEERVGAGVGACGRIEACERDERDRESRWFKPFTLRLSLLVERLSEPVRYPLPPRREQAATSYATIPTPRARAVIDHHPNLRPDPAQGSSHYNPSRRQGT